MRDTRQIIAPSLLAADFTQLGNEIKKVEDCGADWLHYDVMDGRFVPNISIGLPVLSAINKVTEMPLDVHLMIVEPEKYIEDFRKAGADYITVHYEACAHLHRTIHQIKESGAKAGVSLNPHTPVSVLKHVLPHIDLVLIMSVNPGFGGQKFIESTYDKIKELRQMCFDCGHFPLIEVDGGVGLSNYEKLLNAGVDVLVAGSAIFKAEDPCVVIAKMKSSGLDTLIA